MAASWPRNLQVLAGQLGQPSLYADIDDGDPNAPGSSVVVFTGSGTTTISLAESALGDGFHGEGVPCLPVGPLPPPPTPSGAGGAPSGPESKRDSTEGSAAETVDGYCTTDINQDHYIDISDVSLSTGVFGSTVPPAPQGYDVSPELVGDGFVDISDVSLLTGEFGLECYGVTGQDEFTAQGADGALTIFFCYWGYRERILGNRLTMPI